MVEHLADSEGINLVLLKNTPSTGTTFIGIEEEIVPDGHKCQQSLVMSSRKLDEPREILHCGCLALLRLEYRLLDGI